MKPIVPTVKKRTDSRGYYLVPAFIHIQMPFSLHPLEVFLRKLFSYEITTELRADLYFTSDAELPIEGYRLKITNDTIQIDYRDYPGAFYALETLSQLFDPANNRYPCTMIEDHPDMRIRGFMMDISRDKIPTVETIQSVIDKMAALKMNHLELYIEGFSFEYPSFPEVNEGETPLTREEFSKLEVYANDRAIDLCGNQNCFGHMTEWLKRKEFRHLAECPHGYPFHFGKFTVLFPASTMNPTDERSFEHAKKMIDDQLPLSHSPYFNIDCDEPFELGLGKSNKRCKEIGLGKVYVEYVSRLVHYINQHKKTALVWGDVLINHPEVLPDLPKGMVFLDWGYDYDYPFDRHLKQLSDLNVQFVACPGTSTWCSFSSRKRDMLETTNNAAAAVKKYHGLGLITTDWGDCGHLQYLPFSYPGLIAAGLITWCNVPVDESLIRPILKQWVHQEILTDSILALAGYSTLENQYQHNFTQTFSPFLFVDANPKHPYFIRKMILKKTLKTTALSPESYDKIRELIENVRNRLKDFIPSTEEESLVRDEILQTATFISFSSSVNRLFNLKDKEKIKELKRSILDELTPTIDNHARLWRARNREGGLDRSLSRPISLKSVIERL